MSTVNNNYYRAAAAAPLPPTGPLAAAAAAALALARLLVARLAAPAAETAAWLQGSQGPKERRQCGEKIGNVLVTSKQPQRSHLKIASLYPR